MDASSQEYHTRGPFLGLSRRRRRYVRRLPIAVKLRARFSTPNLRNNPNLSDAGWGRYAEYAGVGIQMTYATVNTLLGEVNATITPFFDYVKTAVGNPQDCEIALKPYQIGTQI